MSENDVWDLLVEHIRTAWPRECLHWNESPLELVTRLIDERNDLRLSIEKAVRGIRAEVNDQTQSETIGKICERVDELADVLFVPVDSPA